MKLKDVTKKKLLQENFWKRKIKWVLLTNINNGFDINIELYGFKGETRGSKIVKYYDLEKEIKALGFNLNGIKL